MPSTIQTIKTIIRRDLKLPETIPLEEGRPLIGGDLDVDSLDILLLLTSFEKEFGFKITSESVDRSAFASIATLAAYIERKRAEAGSAQIKLAVDPVALLSKLPHADPFRFVTQVISVEAGVSGRGLWRVSGQEDFFRGHFPNQPIVPGVLIVEALAQMAGLVGASSPHLALQHGRLAQVEVRFRQAVQPPADVELSARIEQAMGSMIRFEVEAQVNGQTVADGSLTLNLVTQE